MKEEARQDKLHLSLRKGIDPFKQADVIHSPCVRLHLPSTFEASAQFCPISPQQHPRGSGGRCRT